MLVSPDPISGFKEFLPQEQIVLEGMKRIIVKHYELFGFAPIEVAALERLEVLHAKATVEERKLIYGVQKIIPTSDDKEEGSTDASFGPKSLAMHFDLTVPFARYVAQNYGHLDFPFRRYQIQKVWRGERPQRGRFREFYQADIDVIGDGELGLLHDAEMPAVINGIFTDLQVGKFLIHLNNRKLHNGLLEHLGIPLHYKEPAGGEEGAELNTLTIIDKMSKVGVEKTRQQFRESVGLNEEQVNALLEFLTFKASTADTLQWLQSQDRGELFATGVAELTEVVGHMRSFDIPEENFCIDLGITRGLDYYTGTVYETTLVNREGVGSVCSGGRYENLASCYIDRKLPGVGISIGLSRLFSVMIDEGGTIDTDTCPRSTAKAIILKMSADLLPDYFKMATDLRRSGVQCEVFLEDEKIGKQIKYADRKRIPYTVFFDQKRKERGVCVVRGNNGDEKEMPVTELVAFLSQ